MNDKVRQISMLFANLAEKENQMPKPKWSHLPNVKYIDLVLADVKKNPNRNRWSAAWYAARGAAWYAAREAAWDAARNAAREAAWDAARDAAWDAARNAARGAVWDAAWGAIAALIAWDHCGSMLELTPNKIRVLAALGAEPAILLESAVIALNGNG